MDIINGLGPVSLQSTPLRLSVATLLLNYSTYLGSKSGDAVDEAIGLVDLVTRNLGSVADSETTYRTLVTLGNLVMLSKDVAQAATEVYDSKATARKAAEHYASEPRFTSLTRDLDLLL